MTNPRPSVSPLSKRIKNQLDVDTCVTQIDLSRSYFEAHHTVDDMNVLIPLMRKHQETTELSMQHCSGDLGMVFRFLPFWVHLKSLDLTGVDLLLPDMESLAAISNLERLNLSHTNIGERSVIMLARRLPASMKELNLTGIQLSNKSLMALAKRQAEQYFDVIVDEKVLPRLEVAREDIRMGNTRIGNNQFHVTPDGDGGKLVHMADTSEPTYLIASDTFVTQQAPGVEVTAKGELGASEFVVGVTKAGHLPDR